MEREVGRLSIRELKESFVDIEFPEYQREPDVWSRKQKQRLMDSILRKFDIASIYLYRRPDGGLECIDGRQRLNAIMSFLGDNPPDPDNGFSLNIDNEISSNLPSPYEPIHGLPYADVAARSDTDEIARLAIQSIVDYQLSVVYLSDATEPDEFNLQFLRLNLGTLINAGEKLNAMVGKMRDLLFEPGGVGDHPFFERLRIPTRRYAKELTAAQVLIQAFSMRESGQFTRARHHDLQKFVKIHADDVDKDHPIVAGVSETLDAIEDGLADQGESLRNRAVAVSVILLVWKLNLSEDSDGLDSFASFLETFLGRLRWQVANMKAYDIDNRYDYLVEFQRHLTQASVEKPAVTRRHDILEEQFSEWLRTQKLTGDAEYETEEGTPPPVR